MTPTEKKKTADTVNEHSSWSWVGLLPIHFKPLTLGQIYEIGEHACQLEAEGLSLQQKMLASAEMLARYKSAPQFQEIFLKVAFRSKWKRRLFRGYILKRLTVAHLQKAVEIVTDVYTANFFLTSIIFLRQANQITEPNPTTPLGQQSEE